MSIEPVLPLSRRGWIAGLVLVVIVCVYVFAVIANGVNMSVGANLRWGVEL